MGPAIPAMLQPLLMASSGQFAAQQSNSGFTPYETLSLYRPLFTAGLAAALSPLTVVGPPAPVSLAKALPASEPAVTALPLAAAPQAFSIQPLAYVGQAPAAAEAKQTAAAANQIVTAAGETITPKQTMAAVASAYTGSAEENGGYTGKDYFGNALQVGTIAVDPDVIPLGSTVYVTGYSYDGLPAGGMMAKASDIGGSIDGSRIDIYVPDSREKAKKFGMQNVTLYVVD